MDVELEPVHLTKASGMGLPEAACAALAAADPTRRQALRVAGVDGGDWGGNQAPNLLPLLGAWPQAIPYSPPVSASHQFRLRVAAFL